MSIKKKASTKTKDKEAAAKRRAKIRKLALVVGVVRARRKRAARRAA